MSITQLHEPHGWNGLSPSPRRGRISQFVDTAWARVRDWLGRVEGRNELAALDDRTLRDIGVSRSDTVYLGNANRADEDDAWRVSLRYPPF
jgi:uncharacterized protein YjiS (DUF1127 family)